MNERIRQLWSQAGGHYNSGNQHTWPEYTIDDPEKFAELILRECAEVVKWTPSLFPNDTIIKNIKETFRS
jgi:hypothetical protein